ncbi:uracil-DNA glycosylase [uncultured Thiothrix sp.]|uniref:uracil-DNA glycosylase n=1 Tax=uncultured Thiothrix sp. TaxID=223185 RepID=UPI002601AB35|nr:uracil-DNA glycosylase [uncultured Thiothrix sp.]HMT92804.1 uracil-DNA glycosylase [Thiolinea sp.]
MDWPTRSRYLKAMGIPLWIPKDLAVDDETTPNPELPATLTSETLEPLTSISKPASSPRALSELFAEPAKPKVIPNPAKPVIASHAPNCSQLNWLDLEAAVAACKLCELHKTRTQTVFGTGHQQARCMIIGEAPGAEEDRQGLPFVGKSGKLLTNMLAAIDIAREDIYIANILKCRPPNNRDPKPEEAAACRGYLERQIALIQPMLILVVGRIAAHNLLQTTTPLGRLRGSVHTLPNSTVPVIVTYHPAYLLRQPTEKRRAWQDLQLARDFLASLGVKA